MNLGVIDGRDVVAVPDPAGGVLDQPGQDGRHGVGVPGSVLGEALQSPPIGGPFDGQDRLGDGVLLDVEGQRRDPLDETAVAEMGESPGEGQE